VEIRSGGAGSGIRHLAALGASFASGPGIRPVAVHAAGRSRVNYPSLLAARLGARLTDLTVSGATTATVLDTPQRRLLRRFPPQLRGLPADADLVTVTAGGNDLDYIGSMTRHAIAARLAISPLTRPAGRRLRGAGVPVPSEADLERTAAALVRIVDEVRRRAPAARVVLVDYLPVLGPETRPTPDAPFSPDQIARFRALAQRIAEVFARAAERTGADLLAASAEEGHALGSTEPWVTGAHGRPPFHPNAAGMRAVAERLERLLAA
jgi:lysophospholipase L1-like esterase